MTEGTGHVIDPAEVARGVLQAAVAANGPGILWNPFMLDDFCRDRLVGLPGEAVLIYNAARSDVPGLLEQRTNTLSLDAAIASVAATLSETESLNETACAWVVTEFARALGYPVPAGTQPMIVASEPSTAGTGPIPSFGSGGAAGPPAASGPTGPAPPPGATLAVPAPSGGPPSGGTRVNRNALGVAVAILLVGTYLGIASAAHLSPFANASSSSPSGPTGGSSSSDPPPSGNSAPDPQSSDPAPDPQPDPGVALPDTSAGRGSDGRCANHGQVTVIRCAGASNLAAGAFPPLLFRTA